MDNKKKKVCLCGSMSRFKEKIREVALAEVNDDKMVSQPIELPTGIQVSEETKVKLREVHFQKIYESDEILVININSLSEQPYIGADSDVLFQLKHGNF